MDYDSTQEFDDQFFKAHQKEQSSGIAALEEDPPDPR